MTAKIIDGKAIARKIRDEVKAGAKTLKEEKGVLPGLAVVLVGGDPASQIYVGMKEKACIEAQMHSEVFRLPENTSQAELLDIIDGLNKNKSIHGILVQLPLPKHIDDMAVLRAIDPKKDVDGFHVINAGSLLIGEEGFVPCTPKGIIELIKSTGIDIEGKNAVVVGRSNIVGKPAALLLMRENATVTICHSRTNDLASICRRADILVAAIGRAEFIDGTMIKPGAVVIDVGTSRVSDKLKGDVEFESAAKVAGYITPVPGGVGPMTIAMLMLNTLEGARKYG
ncbi:MAG: bifunctional methylenetetrahydrofolate dehydrogenase/methenyltetrahydrofolate cyclohydrolase FolD [Christensenellales bacterium]|jgi:methylenetetrahydrofolate dehydrogenase (NADP+)/methenyltetrahydrofolate cyclohydrolase